MSLKKLKKISYNALILVSAICIGFVSCSDDWDDHYKSPEGTLPDKTLWQLIESMPELSTFAELLKKEGYDEVLKGSRMFTVWAPDKESLIGLDISDSLLVKEFINNHVANYSTSASGAMLEPVTMLNGKVIVFKLSDGQTYSFGNSPLLRQNLLASNGILHVIKDYVHFQNNIWEYLDKDENVAAIKDYLYSFNKLEFYPEGSTPGGGVDDEGNIIYLDSVFINYNPIFYQIGHINYEDSTYTMIVPTNEAWEKRCNQAKTYFNFYDKSPQIADSLKNLYGKIAAIKDLVFSNNMQIAPQDSLVSTGGSIFHNPSDLFVGATEVPLSNGSIYITDSIRFKPSQSWHLPIRTEAERLLGRENTLSTVYTRNAIGSHIEGISNNRYIEVEESTANVNPTVTFEIPGTLSAAYNIYCVFVPRNVNNIDETDLRTNKIKYQVVYLDSKGASTQTAQISPDINVTNPDALTKMLLAENFRFPKANYGQEITTVKVKIISDVRAGETATHSRTMLIDCIILEPVD